MGTVAILSSDVPRSAAFCQALSRLQMPAGTSVEWITGGPNIAHNRNLAVQALRGDWLWMLDDDMLMPPDTLTRLLAHLERPDVSIVVPFCLKRTPPYAPVLAVRNAVGQLTPCRVPATAEGLFPVGAAGTAGMLVKASVFLDVPHPWFTVGQWHPVRLDEDFVFCDSAAKAGHRVWVDLDAPMGHIAPFAIWPAKGEDGWGATYHAIWSASSTQCVEVMQKVREEAYHGVYSPELRPPFTCQGVTA